jgi:hypothetical protein
MRERGALNFHTRQLLITLASFWVAQRCLAPDVSTALIESATSPLSLMSATRSSALGHTNPPGFHRKGFNMNNSNDQKSASNQSVNKTASDEKKVTSPQTEATATKEPGDKQEPAKNAQSPAQSSR